MRNYGITVSDVLAAITENRNAFRFWSGKGFDGIAESHTENIRDLRIMLLSIRFPENSFGFTYGDDFTPVIVVNDNDNDTAEIVNDDNAESMTDTEKELVNA